MRLDRLSQPKHPVIAPLKKATETTRRTKTAPAKDASEITRFPAIHKQSAYRVTTSIPSRKSSLKLEPLRKNSVKSESSDKHSGKAAAPKRKKQRKRKKKRKHGRKAKESVGSSNSNSSSAESSEGDDHEQGQEQELRLIDETSNDNIEMKDGHDLVLEFSELEKNPNMKMT